MQNVVGRKKVAGGGLSTGKALIGVLSIVLGFLNIYNRYFCTFMSPKPTHSELSCVATRISTCCLPRQCLPSLVESLLLTFETHILLCSPFLLVSVPVYLT